MYLMNVSPVAATHTEWRTCGPQRGHRLPICFNDSDTELSTRGTPISDKVQMIIESLRSSQSSREMSDEIERNVLSGQEGHPQVCKVSMGSYIGVKSKTESPMENQRAYVSSPVNGNSSDSDSDDSVDRGIEEAILEYLKEKDDHKRKAEPCFNFLQQAKIPRKTPLFSEISKQNLHRNTFVTAGNQFSKSFKAESATAPPVVLTKKHIKNKDSLNDDVTKKIYSNRSTTNKSLVLSKEQTKSPTKTINFFNKVKCPVKAKIEEDFCDSSSDDGIEEAIQRYQLEKKEQEIKRDAFNLHPFKEESDSTSDDGIEEAIRCYQLEQLKEKSVLKPVLNKQKPLSKLLIHSVGGTTMENTKKPKLRKKKTRPQKEIKSVQPPPSSLFIPTNTLSDSSEGEGNGSFLFKVESFKERPALTFAPPKVNTTAELMCAEAILDISKTVMPEAFHHSVGLKSCTAESSLFQSSVLDNSPAEESDVSSIDSEDGIEQEIRKFLEQKAQMHKQPSSSATTQEPLNLKKPEKIKTKQGTKQKKHARLSLTQRRKYKQEISSISNISGKDINVNVNFLPEHGKESKPSLCSHTRQTHAIPGLHQMEQSDEKSSSLDSDEDLDTAIKDLLKTKKKSKKKIKDLKGKSRKRLTDEDPIRGNSLQTKKFKPDIVSKRSVLRKGKRSKNDRKEKSGFTKMCASQRKQTESGDETDGFKAAEGQEALLLHSTQSAPQIKEDSSSVDSDDSIEQEIRRFLAEKAKVSTVEQGKEGNILRNGSAAVCAQIKDEDIKQEDQLAEIPRKDISPLSGQSPLNRKPLLVPQSLQPVISAAGVQSCLTSVQSCSPSLLELADGAGAAQPEQRPNPWRGDVQDITLKKENVQPVLSPKIALSHSNSNKWRQCLGLPTTDNRTFSRSPFYITSSKTSDSASLFPSRVITPKSQSPVTAWSSVRTSRAPFPCSAGAAVHTAFRPPVLNLLSAARQHPSMSLKQSLALGHRSHCSIEGETESMVHIPKDKSVFVELESNRTNHVQVRSRDRSEGEKVALLSEIRREPESMKTDDKDVQLDRAEEFIDEEECEPGSTRNQEKKQGFPTLSLSRAIDPGITFRPCIALTTEERGQMFSRGCLIKKSTKDSHSLSHVPAQNSTVQHVKRRLQFVPVSRSNEVSGFLASKE